LAGIGELARQTAEGRGIHFERIGRFVVVGGEGAERRSVFVRLLLVSGAFVLIIFVLDGQRRRKRRGSER
jgi:hypothetical protein